MKIEFIFVRCKFKKGVDIFYDIFIVCNDYKLFVIEKNGSKEKEKLNIGDKKIKL